MENHTGIFERLSVERANEVIELLHNNIPLEEGGFRSPSVFKHIAETAFKVLGRQIPSDFETLVERKSDLSQMRERRTGKALSSERAKQIFNPLLKSNDAPTFREEDDIIEQRMWARRAVAIVARDREAETGQDHGFLIKECEGLINSKLNLDNEARN